MPIPKENLKNLDEDERKVLDQATQDYWRTLHRELRELPPHWIIKLNSNKEVYYRNSKKKRKEPGASTSDHPYFGALPDPWRLRFCTPQNPPKGVPKEGLPTYSNSRTKEMMKTDPRLDPKFLNYRSKTLDRARGDGKLDIAHSYNHMKLGKNLSQDFRRENMKNKSFRHKYEVVHTLDDPNKGAIGGMNGGVYVVRLKTDHHRLLVEKRFKLDDETSRDLGMIEIKLCRKVFHASINLYIDGFIRDDGMDMGLLIEFCDRGSFDGLVSKYQEWNKNNPDNKKLIPEGFIWHAYVSLCDALAYLALGRSLTGRPANDWKKPPEPGWLPIIHRDIKPDNILLRSRDRSRDKNFYCIISDFGLATMDYPQGHKLQCYAQKKGHECGTANYFAPELCWDKPKPQERKNYFPTKADGSQIVHSAKSDLWALAACVHNLAFQRALSHLKGYSNKPKAMTEDQWKVSKLQRSHPTLIPIPKAKGKYTKELNEVILRGGASDPKERPTPGELYSMIVEKAESVRKIAHKYVPLKPWATRIHDYHANEGKPCVDPPGL